MQQSLTPAQIAPAIRMLQKDPPFDPTSVSWATSSWEDIATVIEMHRAGEIDLTQYWHVGDVREVPFTLYKATVADTSGTSQVEPGDSSNPGKWYNGSSWIDVGSGVSFTTHWVIADVNNGSSSATATYKKSGEATPAFIINQVGSISYARFNYSNTNSGGWNSSALRKYLNGSYLVSGITGYYDGLPAGLRSILLPASVVAASGSSTTTATSTDKLFLPAEKEVFGSVSYANSTAESSLKQWDYFATAANRIKYRIGPSGVTSSADYWWERSPRSGGSNRFCYVGTGGAANSYTASGSYGLAPSCCI